MSVKFSIPASLAFIVSVHPLSANPRLSSWFTGNSGQYARIYESTAAETARTTSTTWTRGQGTQTAPTYADVSEVSYSANWVYIRTTGLASHVMGPWYLDATKSQNFPNFPANTGSIYRIPLTPLIPASKVLTGLGASGVMVNGVSIFDSRDAFSYVSASNTDATPGNGLTGDGVWNRDGYHNEGVTFDASLAHQAGRNYHYHAQPIGLRYQLGDHVNYNATTNRYTEKTGAPLQHSPLLGWLADGLPLYGPYGYSDPLVSSSGVRRMVSGFVLRNGQSGTTNLTSTGRTSLPAWAQRIQTVTFRNGPAVNATYALGHYIEDFDYLGDRGQTLGVQFDLNEQNARWCVTPEFPTGTWAYFTTINSDGTPAFPYTTGRQYFGSPTGGGTTISETVTTYFKGGPNKTETTESIQVTGNSATVKWSAVEGGTYTVKSTGNLTDWTTLSTTAQPSGSTLTQTEAGVGARRFYQVQRTALAAFDSTGFNYTTGGTGGGTDITAPGGTAARGTTIVVTVTLPTTPPLPPANVVPASMTLGSLAGTNISRPSQATARATFVIPAGATTGLQAMGIVFSPGPTYNVANAVTIQ